MSHAAAAPSGLGRPDAMNTATCSYADRSLAIAGVGLRLQLADPDLVEAVDCRTQAYRTDALPSGGYRLDLRLGPEDDPAHRVLHSFSRDEAGIIHMQRRQMLVGVLSMDTRIGHVRIAPNRYAIDSLLRLVLNVELPRVGGALLHAAGVVWGGQGLMFPGVSGAGKSTLAADAGGEPVLTDEMVAVRPDAGQWRLFGTPFHGDLEIEPQAGDWPLRAVVFPDRAQLPGIHRLRRGPALGRLLQTIVNYGDDAVTDRRLLEVATAIASDVPCYAVCYSKGDQIRPRVEEELTR